MGGETTSGSLTNGDKSGYDPEAQGDNTLGSIIYSSTNSLLPSWQSGMSREHYQILRRSDGKLLGETIHNMAVEVAIFQDLARLKLQLSRAS